MLPDLGSLSFFLVELMRRVEGTTESSLKIANDVDGLRGAGVIGTSALVNGVWFVISAKAVDLLAKRGALSVFKPNSGDPQPFNTSHNDDVLGHPRKCPFTAGVLNST